MIRKGVLFFLGALFIYSLGGLSSCNGGEEPQGEGIFTMIANHYVDFAPLERNSFFAYENEAGNLFKVYDFKYYISGIKLHQEGGRAYELPMANDGSQGYYLIDDSDPESRMMILRDIPVGEYIAVSFVLGVDKTSVDIDNAIGPLSVSNKMYDADRGEYFSLALDGMSYESEAPDRAMGIRTGSPHLFEVRIDFRGEKAIIQDGRETIVEFTADLSQLFAAPALVDFAETPLLLNPGQTGEPALQFSKAFSFDHLHNNP